MSAVLVVVVTSLLVGATLLWVKAEAAQPKYTHFPLVNGTQQALMACSAGYALIDRDESPLSFVEEEADQAANIKREFDPLALSAAEGLQSARSRTSFVSFCRRHHLWP